MEDPSALTRLTELGVTPAGAERVVYSFKGGSDGADPSAGANLINVGGTLYGTAGGGVDGGDFRVELDGRTVFVQRRLRTTGFFEHDPEVVMDLVAVGVDALGGAVFVQRGPGLTL